MEHDSEKIESILIAALEIPSEPARQAYVEKCCGNDLELRQRVEKLVENHFLAGDFLTSPAQDWPSKVGERAGLRPGEWIGPYRLFEQIGEGGFGVVFLAEQEQPIRRKVALKVIKPGMDTSQVVARFENERMALALMEHPNIARVLDVGETDSGRPYFVMELVKGVPITQYCDEHHLTTRERLQLFVSVCQAVQHAHQKGIIHRDIKPSNVLIAQVDGRPVSKVIDFGVAKAISVNLLDVSLETNFGSIVGTPQYMSPEQANAKNVDVDTQTDVYSLGVLLYELMTGSPPFDKKNFADAGILEMLRVIREVDPPTPSSKLSSADGLEKIAANRNIEPRQLSSLLRRDLEWIVMKCLEKDRARRYATANGLARDIERYLNEEPVEAGPPGAGYRIRKFLRRNRGSVFASTLLLISLLAGVVGTSIGLVRAERGHQAAREEQRNADRQRDRAERHYQRALEAVDRLLTRVGETGLAPVPFMDATRLRLLEDALEFYRGFLEDEGGDPRVHRDIGRAHGRISRIQSMLGRLDEAEKSCNNAIEIQSNLVTEMPGDPEYRLDFDKSRRQLAAIWHLTGRIADAERLLREVLSHVSPSSLSARAERAELQYMLGSVCHETSQTGNAESSLDAALELADGLVRDDSINPDHQAIKARILNRLGLLYRETQRLTDAQRNYIVAIGILRGLVANSPEETQYQLSLAATLNNLGSVCLAQMLLPQAEEANLESLGSYSRLVRDHPERVNFKELLARAHNNFGLYYSKCDDPIRALAENEKALKIHEELMHRFPKWLTFTYNYATGCGNQAKYFLEQEKWNEALFWYSKSIDALAPALAIEPRSTHARFALHAAHLGRGRVNQALKLLDEAANDYRRTLELSEGERHSNYVNFRPRALANLGEHVRATTEAEAIVSAGNVFGSTFKELASVFSQCSAIARSDLALAETARDELAEKYAIRAVHMLAMANDKGYFINAEQVADLHTSDRLQPILDRDDFKRFMLELEKSLSAKDTSIDQPK